MVIKSNHHHSDANPPLDATIEIMEKENVFEQWYAKWFDIATNVHLIDGSKQVCRLKQMCTPTGADRKFLTTIIDVFLLNYAVRLDEARASWDPNKFPGHVARRGLACYLLTVSLCSS